MSLILTLVMSAAVSAREPKTGYAPVSGLQMYYEIHGEGQPLVLLHGSFMTITNNWTGAIAQLVKSRQVIAVEMQGHSRTADINRDFSYETLADDIAALLDYLKIKQADVLRYSMGVGVAMQVAIRHPENVRKVVGISAAFHRISAPRNSKPRQRRCSSSHGQRLLECPATEEIVADRINQLRASFQMDGDTEWST